MSAQSLQEAEEVGAEDESGSGRQPASDRDTDGDADSPELTVDEVFDILRNSRRRAVISYLFENDGQASVKELTQHVASDEYDVPLGETTPDQHKRVYTALYQCHLERLDDFGVVDFDRDEKQVSLDAAAPQVAAYLRGDETSSAARLELVAAAGVAALVSIGVVGVGPLATLPMTTWAFITVLALVGLAFFRLFRRSPATDDSDLARTG